MSNKKQGHRDIFIIIFQNILSESVSSIKYFFYNVIQTFLQLKCLEWNLEQSNVYETQAVYDGRYWFYSLLVSHIL